MDSVFAFLRTRPRRCILLPSCQVEVGTAPRAVLCAKVQIGLWPVQRCKRERHLQVPGLGPQVSGTGVQVQVPGPGQIQIPNLYPNPNARTWLPTAETRDLKNESPCRLSGLRFPFEPFFPSGQLALCSTGQLTLSLRPSCPPALES